ncbi:MAG: sodium:proton antiporter [Anaerolineae bacterium]|nr:sodium:proton antiporter [Anaerolineae bacterium]
MNEEVLLGIAMIIVLGIVAQWLAWRVKLPSILVLLAFGFLAGPITGLLKPDELLGDLLAPVVSLSVGIILFEGGLSLKVSELRQIGGVVRNLIIAGALVTWLLAAGAADVLLGLDFALSALLGAILVVTGPTVIMPLLRDIRPTGQIGNILRWEGILIDPLGVTLAVLVFEAIFVGNLQQASTQAVLGFLETIVIGGVIGYVAARILNLLLRRYWVPDHLQIPVTLMAVIGAFSLADLLQPEAGLLATTVMGMVVANQKAFSVKRIVDFKENVGVMLISNLFILLAARLELSDFSYLGVNSLLFLAFLMLVVRPLAVWISTWRSRLTWREKAFAAWLAPRGIVAAATASIFAQELLHVNYPQAERLAPLTFLVIIGTVSIYGLTARFVARRLGVAQAQPQGMLIIGAHGWAREIAAALQKQGFMVLLVDTNYEHIQSARMAGLPVFYGNALAEHVLEKGLDLNGIGRLLALTSNDEVNALAALHFTEVFERSEIYQLACQEKHRSEAVPLNLRGRLLFGPNVTYDYLERRFSEGAVVKATPITGEFSFEDFRARYNGEAVPLFQVSENGTLNIFSLDQQTVLRPGQVVISLVNTATSVPVREAPALDPTPPSLPEPEPA